MRLNDAGRPTVRTWLFPVEQAVLLNNWDPIAVRGNTTSDSYRRRLFVPEAFTGTREDPSLRLEPGRLCTRDKPCIRRLLTSRPERALSAPVSYLSAHQAARQRGHPRR